MRGRTRQLGLVAVVLVLTALVGGCGSSDGSASEAAATTGTAAEAIPTSNAPTSNLSAPCSENIIQGRVFDEEMVAACLQISGITSKMCDDGSVIGLINISGTALAVHAGSPGQRVDETVAAPLDPPRPQQFDVDERELMAYCT